MGAKRGPVAGFGHWERRKLRDGQLAREPLVLDTSLTAGPIAAQEARRRLRNRLQNLDAVSLELLELLASELVANSVKHAGLEPADRIRLQVRAARDWIRVEVVDRGRRFEPYVPSKPSEEPSGWGLFIVNQIADRWGTIHDSANGHVWFELRVPVRNRTGAPIAG
jgi:anti-sigma regulatory factor (Ser/Thr protein kinase)